MVIVEENVLAKPRWTHVRSEADRLSAPYSVPPIPVLEIAESNGVDVVIADFGSARETVAGFCDFAGAKIYVNSADHVNRQMFTMAHELGHWILHKEFFERDQDRYQILPRFHKAKSDPFEQEANHFAANLLVPRRLLLPVKEAAVATLASIFGVSREMMENRLKNV